MDRNKKIAEFIRHEVFSFYLGFLIAGTLIYNYHLANWFDAKLITPILLGSIALAWFFERRSAKQH